MWENYLTTLSFPSKILLAVFLILGQFGRNIDFRFPVNFSRTPQVAFFSASTLAYNYWSLQMQEIMLEIITSADARNYALY